MKEIVVASNNAHKVREIQRSLGSNFNLISQAKFNVPSPEESGTTFVENAIIKARHSSKISGLPVIADDSGLEVDALDGAPGIHSARFAGLSASDAENNLKLLSALDNISARKARFQCVIVFMRSVTDATPLIASASWDGIILSEPRGKNGFGYDPLFYIPSLERSAAELTELEKSQLSHRGQALKKLQQMLPLL